MFMVNFCQTENVFFLFLYTVSSEIMCPTVSDMLLLLCTIQTTNKHKLIVSGIDVLFSIRFSRKRNIIIFSNLKILVSQNTNTCLYNNSLYVLNFITLNRDIKVQLNYVIQT